MRAIELARNTESSPVYAYFCLRSILAPIPQPSEPHEKTHLLIKNQPVLAIRSIRSFEVLGSVLGSTPGFVNEDGSRLPLVAYAAQPVTELGGMLFPTDDPYIVAEATRHPGIAGIPETIKEVVTLSPRGETESYDVWEEYIIFRGEKFPTAEARLREVNLPPNFWISLYWGSFINRQ